MIVVVAAVDRDVLDHPAEVLVDVRRAEHGLPADVVLDAGGQLVRVLPLELGRHRPGVATEHERGVPADLRVGAAQGVDPAAGVGGRGGGAKSVTFTGWGSAGAVLAAAHAPSPATTAACAASEPQNGACLRAPSASREPRRGAASRYRSKIVGVRVAAVEGARPPDRRGGHESASTLATPARSRTW
jgi:hypothetical protein